MFAYLVDVAAPEGLAQPLLEGLLAFGAARPALPWHAHAHHDIDRYMSIDLTKQYKRGSGPCDDMLPSAALGLGNLGLVSPPHRSAWLEQVKKFIRIITDIAVALHRHPYTLSCSCMGDPSTSRKWYTLKQGKISALVTDDPS
jgi:hypothetical protein